MTFRILLFSMLAALVLYIPFYHFAPVYHEMYTHVPLSDLNWWIQWSFREEHGGAQIYIAYGLMFLAIGLTACLEYIYGKLNSSRARWAALAIGAIACLFYLWTIRFYPSMADIRVDGQGIVFIAVTMTLAFVFGHFVDRKAVQWSLIFLIFIICMVTSLWTYWRVDYFYFLAPALRTLKGYALDQSYFQYDHLISFLAMAWMKLGLRADSFLNLIDFTYLVFFVCVYFMARHLFFDKRLAVYFILIIVIMKVYGGMGGLIACPQGSPLRLDMWLVLLGLAYWKGPQHWSLGATLGFYLVFHHAFGIIYSVSYGLLVLFIFILNFSKDTFKQYVPNACIMLGGLAIYHIFISSNSTIPGLNYVNYNIGFIPIAPKSFFWYVPVVVSTASLALWKSRDRLPQRYFQTGIFLVLLAIGNLLYFFGRSHENNLISISTSPWLVFFMLLDLMVLGSGHLFSGAVKKYFLPGVGVLMVGLVAFFYSSTSVVRIEAQAVNLPNIVELFKPDKAIDFDFNTLKTVTRGNPNIVFMSLNNDFEYYYYGGYTPPEFSPLVTQFFLLDLMDTLNNRLSKGADIIVPLNELDNFQQNILTLDAKYSYRISDFLYISNNKPAI